MNDRPRWNHRSSSCRRVLFSEAYFRQGNWNYVETVPLPSGDFIIKRSAKSTFNYIWTMLQIRYSIHNPNFILFQNDINVKLIYYIISFMGNRGITNTYLVYHYTMSEPVAYIYVHPIYVHINITYLMVAGIWQIPILRVLLDFLSLCTYP